MGKNGQLGQWVNFSQFKESQDWLPRYRSIMIAEAVIKKIWMCPKIFTLKEMG